MDDHGRFPLRWDLLTSPWPRQGSQCRGPGPDPEFGYRFLADELERPGEVVGERRFWRLCSQQSCGPARFAHADVAPAGRRAPAVHDDHVQRDVTASAPDTVGVTDISEHPSAEGKLSGCAIKDLFSNRIVGYALGERMTAQLTVQRCAPRWRVASRPASW